MNCPRRHMHWQSKRLYWEGAPPGELLCHVARSLRFYGDEICFWVVFRQSFWLRVLPGGARIAQPRWMPERRILGGGRTCGISFWPSLNSSSWWWLIALCSLPGPPVIKITHANGYDGAQPGWVVSVHVLPLTKGIFQVWWTPRRSLMWYLENIQ